MAGSKRLADIVLMFYREEYYDPTEENRGMSRLIIAKQRGGPTGVINLYFERVYQKFCNAKRISEHPVLYLIYPCNPTGVSP